MIQIHSLYKPSTCNFKVRKGGGVVVKKKTHMNTCMYVCKTISMNNSK